MKVEERFLKYVSFHTTSAEGTGTVPSTPGQLTLGKFLAEELGKLGFKNVYHDEFGYVYGVLPPSAGCEKMEAVGLVAHMDTSPAVSGENIKPRTVRYNGGDIRLNNNTVISEKSFPFIKNYVGCDIIVTDGTTLLGADDKAGIAEIITACEYFIEHPEVPHRAIAVCFTPDEEIGSGADHFNFDRFAAKTAYTVDGGEIGEIEYENFNAASVRVEIKGVNIHPGSAKNKMVNAVMLATEFVSMLPSAETPEHTEGYEGFYSVGKIDADVSHASIRMMIRDHDRENFEKRKEFIRRLISYLNAVHGENVFEVNIKDSYYNMKEKIMPHMELITNAEAAMRAAGVEPKIVAIRGGTDGARLSYEGLPCPNLSTGGANFHGVHEFIPVQSMEKMVEVIKNLALSNV